MKRQTYQQILQKLRDVDSWLSGMGFSQKADRIRLHISNICKLEKVWRDEALKKKFINEIGHDQLFWSLIEAAEFADIYSALRDFEPNSLKEKLRYALEGPVNPNNETSTSNIGRNTMFELNLASRLVQGGVPVYLQTNPDLTCEVDGRKIYIQCKRPFSESGIPRNISDACRQLVRDLNSSNDRGARGVIAISVSRIQNPGDKLFVADKEHNLKKLIGDCIQSVGERYRKSWANMDKRIIGLLFHLITPAVMEEDKLLVAAQQVVMFSRAIGGPERTLLRKFCEILLCCKI